MGIIKEKIRIIKEKTTIGETMRVISGKCRGTKLSAPDGMNTRPTTDRIKETLFNILAFDVPGCRFLDVFSGSGAIGIESLSRGAKEATFIEQDKQAARVIRDNLTKTRLTPFATLYETDVLTALRTLAARHTAFDLIFLDPPYALPTIPLVLEHIVSGNLLSDGGYMVLEHATGTDYPVKGLRVLREKKLKTTTLTFYERECEG
jgi:16S rRNA (guanine(966)-N(2))-methyltransferase RsmD